MASIEFPLLKKQTPFGLITDPKIPVVVRTLAGDMTFRFLIDTGADFSLAPRLLARQVGLEWGALPDAEVLGVGSVGVHARLGQLPLRVGGVEVTVRCLFADPPRAPFLLGRADFLDRFALTIDTLRQRLTSTELP